MKITVMHVILVLMVCGLVLVLPTAAAVNGKIAFVESDKSDNKEIWVMNADGSDQTPATTGSIADDHPAWSPDGTKIAFSSHRDANHYEIYVMNADGSDPQRLTSSTYNNIGPAWSPDGTKIAFSSIRNGNWQIYVMNAIDGSNQILLTPHSSGAAGEPAWSPDGTKIAFGYAGSNNGVEYDAIVVMKADGSEVKQLTPDTSRNFGPAWSPDGTKIAFTSLRDGNFFDIYVMNSIDGSDPQRLTMDTNSNRDPAWSPDGTKIAFVYASKDLPLTNIYVMNAVDGSESKPLTTNTNPQILFERPSWGPAVKTNVLIKVKIVPRTLNLGNKGYFLAFVTLPEAYKGATIDMKTVSCSGAPAVRMMKLKIFPRIVGFVFKTSELDGVDTGKKVTLTLEGELKNKGTTYTFTGADDVKVISKPSWQPDDIKDVSKVSDDQLFKKYST